MFHRAVWLSVTMSVLVATGCAAIPPPGSVATPPKCTLEHKEIATRYADWAPLLKPAIVDLNRDGTPDLQVGVYADPSRRYLVLIVSEWGDPQSPELGPIRVCQMYEQREELTQEHTPVTPESLKL